MAADLGRRPMQHARDTATILVVDDELSIHTLLTDFLEHRGYRVRCATSAEDAIALLEQSPVAAVVLDVRMPGRSGLDVLQFVRADARFRKVPVLILTGASFTPDEEAIVASCRAYVFYKQEDLGEFAAYIERLSQPHASSA